MRKFVLALLAGLTFAVLAVPSTAAATHPQVSGTGTCNEETGLFDIVWQVTSDPGYEATGEFVSASRLEAQIVGQTVAGFGAAITPAPVESVATSDALSLTVGIQFSNHAEGDIVENTGSVTFLSEVCELTPEPTPTPTPDPTPPPSDPPAQCVPTASTLACTGLNDTQLRNGSIIAGGALIAGIVLLLTRQRRAAHRA